MEKKQCSWSAALALALLAALPAHAAAQARYRARQAGDFRQQPGPDQKLLASVYQGTELAGGQTKDGWIEVTLDGWIWARSVGATTRDGFTLAVTSGRGENLRAEPNGKVLAHLANGFLLEEVTRDTRGWVQVRRTGWMWGQSLEPVAAVQEPPAPAGPETLDHAVTAHRTDLRRVPDGDSAGSLPEGTPVRVLARSGDWVRVSTEGWIRESDLKPSAPGVLAGVSGAEVRARPADFEGKTVQWAVQYLALQTADELRPEIPRGQRYMLARGPLPESGFLYVMLPAGWLARVERLQPLAEIVIVARIKAGRSKLLGNPVVELVDLAVRQP
jgi:hypothetical protein